MAFFSKFLFTIFFLVCLASVALSRRSDGRDKIGGGGRADRRSPTSSRILPASLCTIVERDTKLAEIEAIIEDALQTTPALGAQLVRAAFHDCITATPDNAASGCNGSLQFELDNPGNGRLDDAVQLVQDAVRERCMSVADGIQFAMAVAVREAGGPDVVSAVVDPANPRPDATTADTVDGELPDRAWSFEQLSAFYKRKGLTVKDLVASSAGAHSLGGVDGRRGLRHFTNDPEVISNSYAENLIEISNLQDGQIPNRQFFTIQSDRSLLDNTESVALLRSYAGCTQSAGTCVADENTGLNNLNVDFATFLLKMSKLTGAVVPDQTR